MMLTSYFLLLLIVILSMDAFAAGLSYGVEKVQVPFLSLFIIAFLSGSMLTASLIAGNILLGLIPPGLTKGISFTVLFLLSLYKFYDALPCLHRKSGGLTTGNISKRVNKEDTAHLSCREAALLALALSIDNISAGLCTGTVSLSPIILLLFTTVIHFLSIRLGLFAGHLLSSRSSHSFAWLGAAILMAISFLKLC
ncbi:MAG: manganese efflux pump [Lachnospiraceae bacterium]|nr:manganese efflux pump [Lachnospiraceae bacterium]MDE7334631.1 manganese efflux pump [Lachnospiraceae bacterium]